MNRKQWEAKAILQAERNLGVPAGWWGTYRDVQGPKGQRVRYMGGGMWSLRIDGVLVSKHDSRAFAIRKAAKS